MRFTELSVITLALGASALVHPPTVVERAPPSLVERDLPTITSVIADVDTNIKAFDSAAKSYSGGSDSALSDAADKLISTIQAGTTKVKGTSELTLNEAVTLTTVVKGLQGDATTLVNDLIAQKPTFEKNNLCSTLRDKTSSINSASKALIDAVVAKVPEEAQSLAAQLASGTTDILNKASNAFSDGQCTDAGGSGSSSSASGGSSSAASSGSAPATSASASATGSAPATSASASATGGATYPTGPATSASAPASSYPTGGSTGTISAVPSSTPSTPVPAGAPGLTAMAGSAGAVALAVAAALL